MRSIAKIVHDGILATNEYLGHEIEFTSGTGNTVGFITDQEGTIWRVGVENWTYVLDGKVIPAAIHTFHECPYEAEINDQHGLCNCSPEGVKNCQLAI